MKHVKPVIAVLSTLILALTAAPVLAGDDPSTAHEAFEQLKSLAGTWHGEAAGGDEGEQKAQVTHEFRVASAGTVVMETMNVGTEHEMINMYHLDGKSLVLTHYCAAGNQPTMKLVEPRSNPREMLFDFTGGTNLDPAKDGHIHSTRLVLVGTDAIESYFTSYEGGQETGTRRFVLRRGE